jgi:diguanylate cyclase (GGDEF)-like protein/PAS domain S-box-containing protein
LTAPPGKAMHGARGEGKHLRRLLRLAALLFFVCVGCHSAFAVQSIRVPIDVDAIDLATAIEPHSAQGDRIQVSTAPGADGIVRRIEVSALEAGAQPSWIVFALTNDSDEQLVRLIVAPHYRLVGSGVVWPDLGSSRITTITASEGNPPERDDRVDADVFRLTLDPGTTVTYVAELRTPNLPQIYLWEPEAFKEKTTGLTLYQGIVIGIAGLLALFLTIVFVVRGALIFPAAAALAWTVLAYVCIDFGFWRKIFGFEDEAERIWRAGVEATLGATLVIFLFAYLNLRRWHVRYSHIAAVWLLLMAAVVALSIYNPPIAAGVARISIATIAGIGLILILYMAARGSDRAVMLIPTWFLLLVWVAGASFTVAGTFANDLVAPGLIGGLVLIVMLIGFTVMQNAFSGSNVSNFRGADAERRALAMTGSGDAIFDWNVDLDQVHVSPEFENQLGLKRGALEGPAASWLEIIHPMDRDRYKAALDGLLQQRCGRINHDIRLRAADGHHFWFVMKARPVVNAVGEVVRVIGALSDVTEIKTAEERMLHDAVHDNLTGLPNRELFFDRLETALVASRRPGAVAPVVLVIDIDRFKQINEAVGLSFGDSVLLTVARRLARSLSPGDTLARLAGDQFGVIIMLDENAAQVGEIVEAMRNNLATPISFGEREVALTVSIGVGRADPELPAKGSEVLKDAEIAMANAKKAGGNRAEFFEPTMRTQRSDRPSLESELRRALDRGEIKVFFQPIVRLEDRTVAGFETLLRWQHPRLGQLAAPDFMPLAEETGLVVDLGVFAMQQTARELSAWQKALEVEPPIFASINVSSRQLLRHDLLKDVQAALSRSYVLRGTLKLELTESLVMENPEFAAQMLQRIREIGAGLSLDDFGTGYSSLGHLQRYHFDTLKIDQSLVRQNAVGARPVILRSVIAMAHDLGMDVVAEGAETESDAVELSQLGCEFAQGFVFGQPLSAADARKLMGAEAG